MVGARLEVKQVSRSRLSGTRMGRYLMCVTDIDIGAEIYGSKSTDQYRGTSTA